MALFVSFEGGEGSGKTTQAEILARRLNKTHFLVHLVHEPGATPFGWYLRRWLKREPWGSQASETISHGAELFLFAAARAELVAKVIRPLASRRNTIVIADRYADSTVAYQGYGRRLPLGSVKEINGLATQDVMPELTFLLDCPAEEGLKRIGSLQIRLPLEPGDTTSGSRMDEEGTRRFEQEPLEFHERVRQGYLTMAQEEPDRWHTIDSTRPIQDISAAVWAAVEERLPQEASETSEPAPNLQWLVPGSPID